MQEPDRPPSSSRPWPGYFIVLEGIDGTGKSTLARALAERFAARGVDYLLTREPTDGPHGKKIRELAKSGNARVSPEEEVDLFIADRREHLDNEILPALRAGKAVILDRYYYSTMAYQTAHGADWDAILARHRQFAPEPDLLVVLELDVSLALERIRGSRGDRPDLFEGAEYLQEVARLFEQVQHPNLLRLDARNSTSKMVDAILDRIRNDLSPDSSFKSQI